MRARGATEASDPEYAQMMNFLRVYSKQQGIQQMIQQQQPPTRQVCSPQYQHQQSPVPQQQSPVQHQQTLQLQRSQAQGDPTLQAQQQLPQFSQLNQLPQMQQSPVQTSHYPQPHSSLSQAGLYSSPLQSQLPTTLQTQTGDQANSHPQQAPQQPLQGTPPIQSPIFSQEQLTALKYQIYAYKLLSKNLPLPEHLQKALFSHLPSEEKSTSVEPANGIEHREKSSPALSTEKSISSPGLIKQSMSDQKPIKLEKAEQFISPYSYVNAPITSYAHASWPQRIFIPSITPRGVAPYEIIDQHQNKIQSRIVGRIHELEKVTVSLTHESNESNAEDSPERMVEESGGSDNVKFLIELKALRLLERQKKLREEIYKGMAKSTTLVTIIDPNAFRRTKKLSLREARMTEKLERQQRADRERQERQKHLDRLQNIIVHGRDMIQWHRTLQAKQSRLGRSVLQYHIHVEKEEQKRIERISKERIKALKADDEEAYLKLIDQTKDTRITHLLKQTDSYLENLARAVRVQQNDSLHLDPSTRGGDELIDKASDDDDDESLEQRTDYYAIAHRFQEEVEQPTILVGGKLKEYQIKGLQWMVSLYNNHLNGILADEMGLGKTIQTLSLITYLIEKKNQNGPFLIIVPLSTLTNWNLEFEKWAPAVAKIVYKGPPNERRVLQTQIKYGNFQVLLTTFEYIIKDKHILGKVKWVHMIIDEGHRMKNVRSKLTCTLTQFYSTRYRLILTGTPLQNNLPELWALLNFVLPKIFNSVKSFDEWFNTPFANTGGQDKIELNEEEALLVIKRLHKVLRPFLLRRLKKDVETELPDKVERIVKCKLSALQSKLYNQMRKHGMLFTNGEKGTAGIKGLNNTIMQLKKICNHPFVFEEVERVVNPTRATNEIIYRVSGKFELLERILPKFVATGHRMLIFFQMTTIMTIMEDLLIYLGIRYMRLDGTVKSDDRTDLLKKFNAPDSPYEVFLLSTRAGGLGLNLQTADTVIIFDSDWNPHQDLQAQDRAHRIGQTKEVRIFRLISENSVEETILARAQYKLDIDGKVIQAGKFA
ncbi:ATP-dependent DNA helicase Snf21, partial [Basidiobolus ranarum]